MPEQDTGSAAAATSESEQGTRHPRSGSSTARALEVSKNTDRNDSKHDQSPPQQKQTNSSSIEASNGPSAPIPPAQEIPAADKKPTTSTDTNSNTANMTSEPPELDDFGLPIRKYTAPSSSSSSSSRKASTSDRAPKAEGENKITNDKDPDSDSDQEFKDAVSGNDDQDEDSSPRTPVPTIVPIQTSSSTEKATQPECLKANTQEPITPSEPKPNVEKGSVDAKPVIQEDQAISAIKQDSYPAPGHSRNTSTASATADGPKPFVSEFSHQQLTSNQPEKVADTEGEWQEMPAYAPYDIYDDDNKLIAKEHNEEEDEKYGYAGLGGAGKGYTKVLLDDDAESATSMDDNTNYLFKDKAGTALVDEDDETQRDAVGQLQATKELLTEGQRIAYVGLTRLELSVMVSEADGIQHTRKTKKELNVAAESMKMWSQKMMVRLYSHMDISPAEQIMIEQLSAHGVMPRDLTPVLMANARVKNPMAEEEDGPASPGTKSPTAEEGDKKSSDTKSPRSPSPDAEAVAEPPPPYEANDDSELSAPVRTPSQMPTTEKIDIDLRWTVLCDLFLVLIADSIYDARSRVLLEKVAKDLEIPWLDICRFEKKVTDALEMQQNAEKENWNEEDHMEARRKMDLKRRYVVMGLATVGGGLVIGLSAGMLAPLIGAGLIAGLSTIGVTGSGVGFLAGAGGAALITSSAAASGSLIGGRAANRRTGAVKTFEYRPLHNNKRVNLIVTVSGWMTGKVDDVRLPFSTVDPVMGDIYSVLWEPEMLTSMGDTINILATEALTQGLQQILGSTILIGLMSALQLPVVLTKLSYLIDNPWTVSLDRANMAGKILADSLIDRNLGTRPVTLVGYSLGSRVIFSCLLELAKKGAYGLVQNVYLFGSPVVVKQDEWLRARSVVAGRLLSGYNRNDWILGYLFRLTNGGIRRIAGLASIEGIPGLENMDVSEFVVGHMDYRIAMPRLLRECGWNVESDEFTEIEDPDPDKHQERQRELINEIEEARKEFEKESKGKKGKFSFFRKKKVEKQEWEIYEESNKAAAAAATAGGSSGGKTEDAEGNNHGVLFDVDAIRAELAKETRENGRTVEEELLQVREIKSTLPPMKLDLSPGLPPAVRPSREFGMRENRSVSLSVVPSRSPALGQDGWGHSRVPSYGHGDRAGTYAVAERGSSPYGGSGRNGGDYGYGHPDNGRGFDDGEDEIQMTFDTAFEERNKPPPAYKSVDTNGSGSGTSQRQPEIVVQPAVSQSESIAGTTRPGIKSAKTTPNLPQASSSSSNPWANLSDDEEDFGREKEISMTFA